MAFLPPLRYVTPSFILRSYQAGDGAHVKDAVNSSIEHLNRFLEWAHPFPTLAAAEMFARNAQARYLRQEDFLLSIWSPDETMLWGGTGFRVNRGGADSSFAWGNAEISMWIRASHAGHGLGSTVLAAMIEWGFTAWGIKRLCWRCRVDNPASARAAEKAGMTQDALLRGLLPDPHSGEPMDTLYYTILNSDPRAGLVTNALR